MLSVKTVNILGITIKGKENSTNVSYMIGVELLKIKYVAMVTKWGKNIVSRNLNN